MCAAKTRKVHRGNNCGNARHEFGRTDGPTRNEKSSVSGGGSTNSWWDGTSCPDRGHRSQCPQTLVQPPLLPLRGPALSDALFGPAWSSPRRASLHSDYFVSSAQDGRLLGRPMKSSYEVRSIAASFRIAAMVVREQAKRRAWRDSAGRRSRCEQHPPRLTAQNQWRIQWQPEP